MSRRLIVNLDFDGVIADTVKGVCDTYINRNYEEIFEYGTIPLPMPYFVRKWNFEDEIPHITMEELDSIFTSETFFNFAPFITDPSGKSMRDLITALLNSKLVQLNIATRGSEMNLELKKDFIQSNFKRFNMDNFNGLLGTQMEKSAVTGDVLIDDVVSNLTSCQCKYKILFAHRGILDAEWNKDYVDYPEIIVCKSVKELYNVIADILRKEGFYEN